MTFMKPTWLAGVQCYGPYQETVPGAWKTVLDWLDSGAHYEMPDRGFGLMHSDPRIVAPEQLHYQAGVEVTPQWKPAESSPVSRMEFRGGTYTILRLNGPYSALGEFISNYRDTWVPRLGLCLDSARPALAIYHSNIRKVAPEDQVADVCLPVTADAAK